MCNACNLRKGTCISAINSDSNDEVQFFHPRQNLWSEHFQIDMKVGMVMGITAVGKVTVENLKMNSVAQVAARKLWVRLGLFPQLFLYFRSKSLRRSPKIHDS